MQQNPSPQNLFLSGKFDWPKKRGESGSRGEISEFPQLVCSFLNSIWTSLTPGTTTAPGEGGWICDPEVEAEVTPRLGLDTFRLNRSSLNEMYGSVTLRATLNRRDPNPPIGPKAPIYQTFVDLEFPTNKNMGVLDTQMGLGKVPCWVYFSWGFEA